mmetsp:Transcript_7997/g.22688  ORF Transcript_7997/g.22688 Transcript_7997/m.22688 type:complete len:167 (-) Transcript_7997:1209-1709(-)
MSVCLVQTPVWCGPPTFPQATQQHEASRRKTILSPHSMTPSPSLNQKWNGKLISMTRTNQPTNQPPHAYAYTTVREPLQNETRETVKSLSQRRRVSRPPSAITVHDHRKTTRPVHPPQRMYRSIHPKNRKPARSEEGGQALGFQPCATSASLRAATMVSATSLRLL